jgi:YesN/AraC family two-component response regulator
MQQPKILIVDDESDIRDMLSRHFRYEGFEVDTACDGQDALEKLNETKIDLVISDIRMPRMNGVDLLRAIRQQHSTVKTIMITGYVTLENALSCMRLGAETCIFKPLEDLSELDDAVRRTIAHLKHWYEKLASLQSMKS